LGGIHDTAVPKHLEEWEQELSRDVLALGRSLVDGLGVPRATTGRGLASVVLSVGRFHLLVTGIPIPVFGYVGDDHQEVQRAVSGYLKEISHDIIGRGYKIELRTFTACLHPREPRAMLQWLPGLRASWPQGEPALLGTQLVVIYPFSSDEIRHWPVQPEFLVRAVQLIELAVPELYRRLDAALAERASEAARTPSREFLFGFP